MKPSLLFLLLILASHAGAQTYTVTDLGALNGSPTYATAINDIGVISAADGDFGARVDLEKWDRHDGCRIIWRLGQSRARRRHG